MSALTKKFEAAVANSKNLSERPDNATLLKLYALYKQGSVGDNVKGTSKDDAMQQYVDLIESLS